MDSVLTQGPVEPAAPTLDGPRSARPTLVGTRLRGVSGRTAARAMAHLAAWMPFLWALRWLWVHDWQPVSDASAIALRAWDVLTAHAPLVGQATRLGAGIFDPGPLEYWLLTVPEHLDPTHGLAWGSALWCMAAASIAIEAAWSAGGAVGSLAASAVVLGTVAWMPEVALQPSWNPWFGVVFFIAALATGWAVLAGHRAWWPALVCTASVATQAHLLFALPAVALAVVGLVVGLTDSRLHRSGYRWAWIGLASGAVCWAAPLYQQFSSSAGNLTALLHGQAATGRLTGPGFGLRALAASAGLPPLWRTPLESLLDLNVISSRSAVVGGVVLAVTVAAMAAAIRPLRSRPVAALAAISLIASAGAVATYANLSVGGIPVAPSPLDTLNYLMIVMFPVGLVCWMAVAGALAVAGKRLLAALSGRSPVRRPNRPEPAGSGALRSSGGALVRALGMLAVAGFAVATSAATSGSASQFPAVADAAYVHVVAAADRQITHRLAAQPIALTISAPGMGYHDRRLLLGLVWVLTTQGYSPRISQYGGELGPSYVTRPGLRITPVRVDVRPGGVTIAVGPGHSVRAVAVRGDHRSAKQL